MLAKTTPSLALRLNKRADLLRRIFSFHKTRNPKEYIDLRSSSKFFHKALQPPPLWTSFPHPKYPTLYKLVSRINKMAEKDPLTAPTVVFVSNGVYRVRDAPFPPLCSSRRGHCINVCCSLTLVGESREGTIVQGGFMMQGRKEDHVGFETMTLTNQRGSGLDEWMNHASFHATDVTIDRCGVYGVRVGLFGSGTQCMLTNCAITNSGASGIFTAGSATVHIYGEKTRVMNGLNVDSPLSKIILHAPLTKESISHPGKWGGYGYIYEGESVSYFGGGEEAMPPFDFDDI